MSRIFDSFTIICHASVVSQYLIDKSKLWHFRLGHVIERGLIELFKQVFSRVGD